MLGFRPDQLEGFRIGVTSDRRAGDLIDAFERRGASVLHAPTLHIANAHRDDPVIEATHDIIAARPDVLLATTAYGVRRWFEVADAAGLGDDLVDALSNTSILVRGPKARGGIRAAGLDDVGMSREETTPSLVDKVLEEFPSGLTVAVQLHGMTDAPQLDRLRAVHPRVLTVAPYQWREPDEGDTRVARLIDAVCSAQLDAVTFTSAPAVDALLATAATLGRERELIAALRDSVLVAAVGPVTAAPLVDVGISPIQPDRFRMGALIRLVCEELERSAAGGLETAHGRVQLRGTVVRIGGRRVPLTPTQLAVFRTIFLARGAVVSRDDLARALPGNPDDHVLDMALSRLRTALDAPGLVATVVKRGYRIAVLDD
ncbi:uroporphyrinogen-III synthase [Agromyces sp. MMS17-SY077]|uniref:Uroporphyrinogen-III synthase n=1 Tax=Agromyces seonyuensis TaxID=2662446 RepID=A0A6I4NVE7_9MICO|nr:uroporphyrinogen-III synthase [Agromyces seonyuensis]